MFEEQLQQRTKVMRRLSEHAALGRCLEILMFDKMNASAPFGDSRNAKPRSTMEGYLKNCHLSD